MNESPPHWDRSDRIVLAALLAATLFATTLAIRSPLSVGKWEDDGVYLLTARALAQGEGYRHPQLPGEPFQTKYPILYPMALAAVWCAFPAFPANIPAMQALNGLFALGGLWLCYRLLRVRLELPAWVAGSAAVLTPLNPWFADLIRCTMSEHLFLLLAAGALYLANGVRAGSPRAELLSGGAVGTLAALAYLTRSIGLVTIPVVLVVLVGQRRFRALLTALLSVVLLVGGSEAWRASATRANAAIPAAAAFNYDLNYGAWIKPGAGAVAWVAFHNLPTTALALFTLLAQPSINWLNAQFAPDATPLAPFLGLLGTLVLLVCGAPVLARRGGIPLAAFLVLYLGMVLVWPFGPERFVVPLLPFVLALVLVGAYRLVDWGERTFAGGAAPTASARGAPRLALEPSLARNVVFLVILGLGVNYGTRSIAATRLAAGDSLAALEPLAELFRTRTPPNAVIASPFAGYFHLVTARKIVPFVPSEDPVSGYYPADRSFWACGRRTTPQQARNYARLLEQRALPYYQTARVSHLVVYNEDRGLGLVFKRFREGQGDRFRLADQWGVFRLYEHVP